MLDAELTKIAQGWAEKVLNDIIRAFSGPEYGLEGESLKVYNDLKEWGWLEDHPLENDASEGVLLKLLSQQKYSKLKWDKDHPPEPKLSKWEKVMGKVNKK